MLSPQQRWELSNLIGQQLAGEAPDDDVERLEAVLLASPEARQYYYRAITLHSELFWGSGKASGVELAESVHLLNEQIREMNTRPRAAVRRRTIRLSARLLALSASLLLVGYFVSAAAYVMFRPEPKSLVEQRGQAPFAQSAEQKVPVPFADPNSRNLVAAVTAASNAEWSAPANKSAIGNQKSEIAKGEPLSLDAGIVELQLKQGVTLRIEAPARWTIDGDNRATLQHGKLFASVPRQAIGFTVTTPTATVVDLGTEFGVQVDEQGSTDTQVFKGEVCVAAPFGQASPARQPVNLRAGQAAHIASDGAVSFIGPLAAWPEQFLDTVPAAAPSPYARSVMQTDPVAYWDFSQTQNETTLGQDRMQGYPFDLFQPHRVNNLGLVVANGFPGMGASNIGLSMSDSSRGVRIDFAASKLHLPTDHYSAQVWFSPTQAFEQQWNYYLVARGNGIEETSSYRDAVMIMGRHATVQQGRVVFFDGNYEPVRFTVGKIDLNLHAWYQMVFVRDGDTIRVYLNGELECQESRPWLGGDGEYIVFGQRLGRKPGHGLVGQFDELALWGRALTTAEVASLYAAATKEPDGNLGEKDE